MIRKERDCANCGRHCRPTPPRTICQVCKITGIPDAGLIAQQEPQPDPVKKRQEIKAEPTHTIRSAAFDIESTSLNASFGRLLCACFKFSDDQDVITVTSPRVADEPEALRKIGQLWDAADVVVTWNGKRFDIPFVNGRRMFHGMEPLIHQKMHKDLMYEARKLRMLGSRMDSISKDMRTRTVKYDVPAWRWVLAAEGDEESLAEIVRHCEQDVLLTEELLNRLKPMILRITK